ncbi:MAG: hypothetical protein ACO1G6_03820, partial [Bacteroidota bacterium]
QTELISCRTRGTRRFGAEVIYAFISFCGRKTGRNIFLQIPLNSQILISRRSHVHRKKPSEHLNLFQSSDGYI